MSDVELEVVQKENAQLKQQLLENSQGFQTLLGQIEAYKGELSDARTICFQLRLNIGKFEMQKNILEQQLKNYQAQIDELKANKPADVPPKNLEGKPNKS